MFLLKTRRGLLLLVLLFAGGVYLVHKMIVDRKKGGPNEYDVPKKSVFVFPGINGPSTPSIVKPEEPTSWRSYNADNPSAMAILLTDTESHWLGLVHGLSGIGIPFTITRSTAEAIKHKAVLVYPLISGKVLSQQDLQSIAAVPRNGGTLIAVNVYGGGFNEVFAYDDIVLGQYRKKAELIHGTGKLHLDSIFSDVIDREVVLSGGNIPDAAAIASVGYTRAKTPLINFDDGTACLAYKDYGVGNAYAFGLDIGNYFLRNMDGRGYDPGRAYVNKYEAGTDIFLRVLKEIYVASSPDAVTISPVAFGKPFSLIMTHDIDYTKSIVNAAQYAAMEKSDSIKATYFIQTKYVRDWNDDIFFNSDNIKYLQQVYNAGMEIGSHSVAHSRVFAKFPEGSGAETYPSYTPFVKSRTETFNGSVLGELRVSKYLLEHFTKDGIIHSFRPGHLSFPFSLPQSLEATGYSNSSSMTAGNVQTFLPCKVMYNAEFVSELNIVEVPVAIEDEAGLPLLQRFDSTVWLAGKLSKYGGVMNILIHTDTLGQKYAYEQKVIAQFRNIAWCGSLGDFCDWWRQRSNLTVTVKKDHDKHIVTIQNDGSLMNGLTLNVPDGWKLQPMAGIYQNGMAIIITEFKGQAILTFGRQ